MAKTRVLVDTFHLLNALTGIRSYTVEMCKGLERLDHPEFEFFFAPDWKRVNDSTLLKGRQGILGKIINHLLYFVWKQIVLPLKILVKGVDIIITPDYLLPYFKFGASSITVFHDTFYWEMPRNYNPIWRRYFLFSVRKGLNKKSIIFADSAHSKERIEQVIVPRQPVEVVYLSPPKIDHTLNEPSLLADLELSKPYKYFLHVGVFDKRKNLELLVESFHSFASKPGRELYKLVLVGSKAVTYFHDSYSAVSKLIDKYKLDDKVIRPGFISKEMLSTLYHNAFGYIFPSLEEGFGIPSLEAMNSKIPVIVSDQPALVEVSNGAALVFQRHNKQDLVKKMEMLEEEGLRNDLVSKGLERASFFSEENFISQILSHLNRKA